MKLLKTYGVAFLLFGLGAFFCVESEPLLFSSEAEIAEESTETEELEITNSGLPGGGFVMSGGGGDDIDSLLSATDLKKSSDFCVSKQSGCAPLNPPLLRRFPYYILYCNLKLPFC